MVNVDMVGRLDYHMASDELETINFPGMEAIADAVARLVLALAEGAELGPPIPGAGSSLPCHRGGRQPDSTRSDGLLSPVSVRQGWGPGEPVAW
ncbi:hypothetical protein G6O69_38670 [Pseudenhygromyxa sp. WMMC2535]|uniref:hypothetical protein n=1 Tax=Pseudenhygromyxa sp. WMMC2535 TaxID=2712867 RepID=UPI001594F769|nr:hypothetical protein [Pseudenhygromyxa sp. WMMC2535]NVB43137.1 hypothetical protein [Pseudenhygromyxa sp. WMMC2535]NVB43785.1 hypothetical protein [Pseudenhygromyxa sp. WMMC2535]